MLIIANHGAIRIRRECCLSCSRKTEKKRRVAAIPSIRCTVERENPLLREEKIHRRKQELLHTPKVRCAVHEPAHTLKIHRNQHIHSFYGALAEHAIVGSSHCPIVRKNEEIERLTMTRCPKHVIGEERYERTIRNRADRKRGFLLCPNGPLGDVQRCLALEKRDGIVPELIEYPNLHWITGRKTPVARFQRTPMPHDVGILRNAPCARCRTPRRQSARRREERFPGIECRLDHCCARWIPGNGRMLLKKCLHCIGSYGRHTRKE